MVPENSLEHKTLSPRIGVIVWGSIFLVFSAWVAQRTFFPSQFTTQVWLTILAIGLGLILLTVGIIAAIKSRSQE